LKKSIKYAGIAAATLLAVAPIAAPVFASNVTTVQAAATTDQVAQAKKDADAAKTSQATADADAAKVTTAQDALTLAQKAVDDANAAAADSATQAQKDAVTKATSDLATAKTTAATSAATAATDAKTAAASQAIVDKANAANEITNDNITTAVKSLKNILTSVTYGDNSSNGSYPAGLTDKKDYDNYMSSTDFLALALLNGQTISAADAKVLADPDTAAAQVKLYAVDNSGKKINFNDYSKLLKSVTDDNGSIKYHYTIKYNDKDGDAQTPEQGNFTLNDNNYAEVKTMNVTFTNPLNVAYGSKVVDASLSSTIDGVIKDQKGNEIDLDNDANTTAAGNIYTSMSGAVAAAKDSSSTTDQFTDKTFGDTDKTYYQPVTITVKANKMGTDKNNETVTPKTVVDNYNNGEDNYSVTVNGKNLSSVANGTLNATDTTVTFIREVHVSEAASWTVTDQAGVVTTKSDKPFYTLKNGDNQTAVDRALAKNTAWKTDKVRTDQNGNKQYRVSTDEWIDADSVTFSDSTTAPSTGALTDITPVDGKVTTAGPASFLYLLYSADGKQSSRALPGLSAWRTDKKATDANGNTVYRVSTDEWVVVDGAKAVFTAY